VGVGCTGFGNDAGFPAAAGATSATRSTVTTPGNSAGSGVGIHNSAATTIP
jgi:hypothetical protein